MFEFGVQWVLDKTTQKWDSIIHGVILNWCHVGLHVRMSAPNNVTMTTMTPSHMFKKLWYFMWIAQWKVIITHLLNNYINSVKWLCYKEQCIMHHKYFRCLHKTNTTVFTTLFTIKPNSIVPSSLIIRTAYLPMLFILSLMLNMLPVYISWEIIRCLTLPIMVLEICNLRQWWWRGWRTHWWWFYVDISSICDGGLILYGLMLFARVYIYSFVYNQS